MQWRHLGLRSFLTSSLGCGKWLNSRPGRCTPGKELRYPLNRRLDGPKSRRVCFLGKRKLFFPIGIRNPDGVVRCLVAIPTTLPVSSEIQRRMSSVNISLHFTRSDTNRPFHGWGGCHHPVPAEVWARFLTTPCVICDGLFSTGTVSSPSSSLFTCQYHSTILTEFHSSTI